MRHPTRLLSVTLGFLLGIGLTATALARNPGRAGTAEEIGFQGTPAELVGYAVNQLLIKGGHQVVPADARLTADLQEAFGGSTDFQWRNTIVFKTSSGQAFSMTLPAAFDRIGSGEVALGVLEQGTLARAFRLSMTRENGTYQVSVDLPDGTPAIQVDLERSDTGRWLLTPQDLLGLATVLYPSAAKGLFDPIIETLQGILDALYTIKDLINMAICIVNESIEMFNDLNCCGWGETRPGGGAIAELIICTIQDVIEFLSEMTERCL